MDRPHIRQLRVVDFGCVKDVTVDLTPLHAFIGPNDSGKSTLLRALRTAVVGERWPSGFTTFTVGELSRTVAANGGQSFHPAGSPYERSRGTSHPQSVLEAAMAATAGTRLLRLDPDAMRLPNELIAKVAPMEFDERGHGLSAVYDALLSRHRRSFDAINERLRTLFPTVQDLELSSPTSHEKVIGVRLLDGTEVSIDAMSEGMLYWLAFAALRHLSPVPVLLIEEPENGLHPARIAEVVRLLREVSAHTQIILATHSPLVINELRPEEVTVLTRTLGGTRATPIAQTKNFEQRSKVYALGELWLSYADGDLERELVSEADPATSAAG